MKFEYVGIFMPKMKGWDYEKENNMYGTCYNDAIIDLSISRTLAMKSISTNIR